VRAEVRVHIKYRGSDTALEVDHGSLEELTQGFEAAYRRRFAFTMPGVPLIVESVAVELIGRSEAAMPPSHRPPRSRTRCRREPWSLTWRQRSFHAGL